MPRLTPAVLRALDILELFLGGHSSLGVGAVLEATGLPRSTAHELLFTLTERGYLRRDRSGSYSLGVKSLQLGNAYAARFDLLAVATQATRALAQDTGFTCSAAILEQADVFYLAKVEGRDVMALASSVGKRVPASCTALGKAIMARMTPAEVARLYPSDQLPALTERSITTLAGLQAELTAIRNRGYATEREESGPGVACVAMALLNTLGDPVAAISISVPVVRWEQGIEPELLTHLRPLAWSLSAQLGYAGD